MTTPATLPHLSHLMVNRRNDPGSILDPGPIFTGHSPERLNPTYTVMGTGFDPEFCRLAEPAVSIDDYFCSVIDWGDTYINFYFPWAEIIDLRGRRELPLTVKFPENPESNPQPLSVSCEPWLSYNSVRTERRGEQYAFVLGGQGMEYVIGFVADGKVPDSVFLENGNLVALTSFNPDEAREIEIRTHFQTEYITVVEVTAHH